MGSHEEMVKICFLLLILDCLVGECNYPRGSRSRPGQGGEDLQAPKKEQQRPGFRLWSSGPNFDTELPQDVTGVVGQTAYLTCRVFDRTNKTISWIRHVDLHILTVGRYTYTADNRYQSIYNPTSDQWILQIKYLQKRDSGMYECQVSTEPVRSFFVRLNILEKLPSKIYRSGENMGNLNDQQGVHASIVGGEEVHVEQGSTLNLTCVVKNSLEKPHYLLWYHNNKTIDYTSPRGGISVVNSGNSEPGISSTLLIHQVGDSDSGAYSCRPSNTEPTSTIVYVIRDEHQEKLASITNGGLPACVQSTLPWLLASYLGVHWR